MLSYVKKKLDTLRMLFYYRVIVGGIKIARRIRKAVSQPYASYDLVIIDDSVPKSAAGFRNYEFAFLLKNIKNSALYGIINYKHGLYPKEFYTMKRIEDFDEGKERYCRVDGIEPNRVHPFFLPWTNVRAKLAYIVFLNTAAYLIDYLEEHKIKFILELYPGGGLTVQEHGPSFEKLKRVLGSPSLHTVLATQINTYNFILEHDICPKEKVVFKYGGILAEEFMNIAPKQVKYGVNKDTIDICFGASKYMPRGLDKGYDVVIAMAHLLLEQSDKFRFHIFGNFNEHDIEIDSRFRKYFSFDGYIKKEDTIAYYTDKDIVVSPNRAYVLDKGAFDGFPTGTTAEAGLQGLCMLLTDPLKLNCYMEEGKDAIFLQPDAQQFADFIIHLAANPDELYDIGERGKRALQKGLNYYDQLDMRLALTKKSLEEI